MTQGAVVITAQVRDTQQARRELESLGRTSSQSGSQIAKANQEVATSSRAAAEEAKRMHTEMIRTAGSVATAAGQVAMLSVAIMEAKSYTGATTTSIALLTGRIVPLGVAALGAAVAIKALADSNEYLSQTAVPAAAASESAMKSLAIVTERTGNSFAEVEQTLGRFDDALTSKTSVAQAIRTFNSMGVSVERQTELIDAMRDGIVAMGGDVNTQLPLMALAIKRQEGELLDNMGVVSTVEQMYKNYAATIGTTADKLNQAQREEAVMQGVLTETAKFAGSAAGSLDTYNGKLAAVATEHRKLAEDIGEIIMPFKKLGAEWDLLTAKAGRYLVARVKALPGEYLSGNIGGMGPLMDPLARGEQLGPGSDEEIRKRIKALQEYSASLRELRKGGFGPLFPDRMGEDEAKHYNNVAAETAKAEQEAKREAERKRREREQEAQRIGSDQKRLREQLNRDLALIDLEGYGRERQQAMQAHQERLRLAHGDNALMLQSRKLYYAEIAKIDANEAKRQSDEAQRASDELGRRIERETAAYLKKKQAEEKAVDDLKKANEDALRDGITSGIQAGLDGGLPALQGSFESASRTALTKGIVKAIEGSAAHSAMGQLGAAFANPFVAAFAVAFSAGINQFMQERKNWETLQDRYITKESERPQWQRDLDSVNQQRSGIESRIGQLDRILEDERKHFIDRQNAESERNSLLQQLTKTEELTAAINREAAEEQRKAAEQQSEAARQRRVSNEAGRIDQYLQNELLRVNLAEKAGTLTAEEAARRRAGVQRDAGMVDIRQEVVSQLGGSGLSGLEDTIAQSLMQALESGMSSYDVVNRGEYGGISFQGLDLSLVDYVAERLKGLELAFQDSTSDRVLPGSSPQNASYTHVVSMPPQFSFAPKEAFMRSSGPGTRRDDSNSARAINVGGRR